MGQFSCVHVHHAGLSHSESGIVQVTFMLLLCVLADDDNRIALKPLTEAEDCQGDYINACYIDVSCAA